MQPQFPGYPVPGYPAPPAQYAPPAPPQYGYPAPPAQYAPVMPGGYGQPTPPAPAPVGSLDSFYGQPSASNGPALKFKDRPIGTSYIGVVAREVTDADIRPTTDNNGVPQFYRGGQPKFTMVVPMLVPRSPEYPDGQAGWWVKGQSRDELTRAMAAAGAPVGPPEAGAIVHVTLVGIQPVPNMNAKYLYRVEYQRPTGDPEATYQALCAHLGVPVGAPVAQAAPAQVAYPPSAQQYAPPVQGVPAQPVYGVMGTPVGQVPTIGQLPPAPPQYSPPAQVAPAAPAAPAPASVPPEPAQPFQGVPAVGQIGIPPAGQGVALPPPGVPAQLPPELAQLMAAYTGGQATA